MKPDVNGLPALQSRRQRLPELRDLGIPGYDLGRYVVLQEYMGVVDKVGQVVPAHAYGLVVKLPKPYGAPALRAGKATAGLA